MQGWITLHRKIEENELWLSEPFTRGQAWVDLLLIANHKPQLLYKRNIPITIERGQVGWSQEKLAKRWKWGRKKVETFLKTLENAQQIKLEKKYTLSRIIIINYDKYQQKEQQSHNSRTTDRTNNNNDNNENNIPSDKSQGLADNKKDMGWNKESEDAYEEREVNYDSDGSVSEKKKGNETARGYRASDVVEYWNQYGTFADLKRIKKLNGIAKNPTTNNVLLPECKPTKDVLIAIGVCAKRYELEDFELAIDNYIRELINRAPSDSWAGKRYSLYDLVKNKGYLLKTYVNR
jgi:hypothetical protein